MNKFKYVVFLTFFCLFSIKVFAQNRIDGGYGNTITIYEGYSIKELKKELGKITTEFEQFKQFIIERDKSDSIMELNKTKRETEQQDSVYRALIGEHKNREIEYRNKETNYINHIHLLDSIIHVKVNKKYLFAPFGIKQFKNEQDALAWTFVISQIVVPVALGVGFGCAADWNHKQYLKTLGDQYINDYYKEYENYRSIAIWSSVISAIGIYAMNILCNYYCTKIDVKLHTVNDLQGNFGIGISINLKL